MVREKKPANRRLAEVAGIALLLPLILPLLLIALMLYWLHRLLLYVLIWCIWLPRGKDALVVYSDSPIWRDYMMQQVVPLLEERAVVLNWSERSQWPRWSFATHVFRSFGGNRDFNPMVVLFRPLRRAKFFRFWSAFKEWKHGKTFEVDWLQRELNLYINKR
jgi:hypothetical protein